MIAAEAEPEGKALRVYVEQGGCSGMQYGLVFDEKRDADQVLDCDGVPVVVDAGLAVPSDASQALEMGASAVLVNTAIAQAQDPGMMGEAFKAGVEAGRKAYLAGRIDVRREAIASSPVTDVPNPITTTY